MAEAVTQHRLQTTNPRHQESTRSDMVSIVTDAAMHADIATIEIIFVLLPTTK